jgi:hypothetical protein
MKQGGFASIIKAQEQDLGFEHFGRNQRKSVEI